MLTCDLADSTRASWFQKEFPDRFIEVGVAEQNLMGISAGLAKEGKIPFACSYAEFNPGRNWEQLRISVCYNNLNVNVQGCHAGITVGADGATHQMLEDIALTRSLPNMTVIVPCDALEAQKAVIASARIKGPVYIRCGRAKTPFITKKQSKFRVGKADIMKEGRDVCIIACGIMVNEALEAAEQLRPKINAAVINCHTIKPIDKKTIIKYAKKAKAIVTAEEHQINGGLGSAVAEVLAENYPVKMKRVGILDRFGESGKPRDLMKKYKITSRDIVKAVKQLK